MRKSIKIVLIVIGVFSLFNVYAQNVNKQLILFADRNSCISGDTLWFKVWVPAEFDKFGNIVHVQLETASGNLISSVTQKNSEGCAEGYIPVPDSLGTGLCFLTSFLNAQRNESNIKTIGKSVYIYNRFEEHIPKLPTPKLGDFTKVVNGESLIDIHLKDAEYKCRESVSGEIVSNSDEILFAIVCARIVDPFADKNGGFFNFNLDGSSSSIPTFAENNGILVCGNLRENGQVPHNRELVFLSIPGEPPYLDYYYSGEKGDFYFFLKEAKGKADITLQTVGNNNIIYSIQQKINYLKRKNKISLDTVFLTPTQADFIDYSLKNSFYSRLFNRSASIGASNFSMPVPFGMPFYGLANKRVVPDEFFDLPDFQEISRELLPGLQLRIHSGEVTLRMLNIDQQLFFDAEPLRLLNGIPVFNNSFIASLKSTDISYIDLVQSERIFGDLRFDGVLAVTLNNRSNSWMAKQPNIYPFRVSCLQGDKSRYFVHRHVHEASVPDIRQNYLWEVLPAGSNYNFSFQLSDVGGVVEISVEGLTKSNRVFKTSKIIEVK